MATAAPQMTAQQGHDVMFSRVYSPAFFNKLASHGIRPANEAEGKLMLENAEKLRVLYDHQQTKVAEANGNKLTKLGSRLDQQLAALGLASPAAPVVDEIPAQINQAAKQASANPELAAACLALLAGQSQAAA